MKLTIIALGSRGDVQPCVALGRGLADAGHSVRVATMVNFEGLVRGQGLDFFPVEGDAQALVNQMLAQGGGMNLIKMYRSMMRSFGAITDSYHAAFIAETLRDADAILCQLPGGFYGYDLAERLGVPYMALSVIPQEVTGAFPLSLFPFRVSLGRWYNRLTYTLGQQMAWQPFRKPINRYRNALGLPNTSFFRGNMGRMARERVVVIQGFSEHVIPTPPDWGNHIHTTGYWVLDEPEWEPPAELSAFLDAGDAPVFIGFGSMPVADPEATTRTLLDALDKAGRRGVLLAGWANIAQDALPETVFPLDYAPYTWLFPRMAAVLHHGGSGTTGLALRSGVPSLVVPFAADQPFWGKRTHELGVGPAPIPFRKLTANNLADAIRLMTTDTAMQQRAAALHDAMAGENGIATAVNVIRDVFAC